ncbi:P protein-like isoform X1 [Acropora millepora]|uniref:P protein-like isoform X1 n=2 Tax=Acropora millepora TaxID=45264 RepID=UPI001CF56762|nr:P protein-like isoform X1 [Acropora millepora]
MLNLPRSRPKMALRRFGSDSAGSTPRSVSPALHSCLSESPVFHTPRSLSPQDEIIRQENADASEIAPLMTVESHYGSVEDRNPDDQRASMLLHFGGRSSRDQMGSVSKWKILRDASKMIKPWFFFFMAVTFAVFFARNKEISEEGKLFVISNNSSPQYFKIHNATKSVVAAIQITGPFVDEDHIGSSKFALSSALVHKSYNVTNLIGKKKSRGINSSCISSTSEAFCDPISVTLTFNFTANDTVTHLMFTLNTSFPLGFSMNHFLEPICEEDQIIIAFVILIGVYILIIFELVHRATAAMLGSLGALAALSYVNKRPPLQTILTWVQWETLALLFGMMILVAVFAKTGFFDYLALKAYKLSRGHVWRLITLLCACTAITSAFLDNVTVILLLTPVTVTLCQVLNLNPTYILIAEIIFSNIGGAATAMGDPPNILLVSNKELRNAGIKFGEFTQTLSVGILFCLVVAYLVLRLIYRNVKIVNDDPPIIEEMKREAEIWRKSADRLPCIFAEDKTVKLLLLQKAMTLENRISNLKRRRSTTEDFQQNLQDLERKYFIRDRVLLVKSSIVIVSVIVLLFVQSFVDSLDLGVGWIAILGAILLILLADVTHFEELMEQVEWTTLVFFCGLFILMKSLEELGLVTFIGDHTSKCIKELGKHVPDKSTEQLGIAMIFIVWVSALVSSFIDNIPFTTAMIPVILELHRTTGLNIKSLVWAFSFGSCLGGNGTLIAGSANVVCAGLAEQYGYPIKFNTFFRVGFLIMLATTTTATVYLLASQQQQQQHHNETMI